MSTHAAKHHRKAAMHHERAAQQHRQASTHYESGNRGKAAHHAQTARGYALHANDAANEASRHHAHEDNEMRDDQGRFEPRQTSERDEDMGYGRGKTGYTGRSHEDDLANDSDYSARSNDDADEEEDDNDTSPRSGAGRKKTAAGRDPSSHKRPGGNGARHAR